MKTEDSFNTEEGALLRARLHIRSGRRRLRQGKISAGIVTLYDAMLFALQWYVMSPERRKTLRTGESDDLNDDWTVFAVLTRSGVLDGSFDYDAFNTLVEEAANQEMPDYDYRDLLRGLESVMTQLGVMPFEEGGLPPEDPSTF